MAILLRERTKLLVNRDTRPAIGEPQESVAPFVRVPNMRLLGCLSSGTFFDLNYPR